MYGAIAGAMINAVEEGRILAKARDEKIKLMRSTLSPEDFKEWEKAETEERRHQEICRAIRASKPDPVDNNGISMAGLLIGGAIIGSMGD